MQFMHIHNSKASLKDKSLSKEQNQDAAEVCVTIHNIISNYKILIIIGYSIV